MGRVAIGYDPINYTITTAGSNIGGAKTHTLSVTEMPPHSHFSEGFSLKVSPGGAGSPTHPIYNIPWYNWGPGVVGWSYNVPNSSITGGAGSSAAINTTGGSTVAHNNMQPYIVTLFIQRIPTT
jgi:microcystin-dependent protein